MLNSKQTKLWNDLAVRQLKKQELIKMCVDLGNAVSYYPFEADNKNCAVRHTANKKWFAMIYEMQGKLCINLKCEPMRADFLRSVYNDVVPGYHMNKTHWNTVYLNGDVPEDMLLEMIKESYRLTAPAPHKIKYFTYLLRCADGSLYCGYTNDVAKRVERHNSGKGARYTKSHRPVKLVHSEGFYTKSAAMQRECEIKRMSRGEKLALIGE